MSGIAGLVVLVSQHGFWFAGDTNTISFEWKNASTPAVLSWQLQLGEMSLAENSFVLGGSVATVSLEMPPVRSLTVFYFHYQLRDKQSGVELGKGKIEIDCYPRDLLARLEHALQKKRVVVFDRQNTLSNLLRKAGIRVRNIQHESELQLTRPDFLVIAPDQIQPVLFSQSLIWEQVADGAKAIVFRQSRVTSLAGYSLQSFSGAASWAWQENHPLLEGIAPADQRSLLDSSNDFMPVVLPHAEQNHAVVYWPGEMSDDHPARIRTLLAGMPLEKGWFVLCQLETENWERDPRSQLLLYNALIHLNTRPLPATRPVLSLTGENP